MTDFTDFAVFLLLVSVAVTLWWILVGRRPAPPPEKPRVESIRFSVITSRNHHMTLEADVVHTGELDQAVRARITASATEFALAHATPDTMLAPETFRALESRMRAALPKAGGIQELVLTRLNPESSAPLAEPPSAGQEPPSSTWEEERLGQLERTLHCGARMVRDFFPTVERDYGDVMRHPTIGPALTENFEAAARSVLDGRAAYGSAMDRARRRALHQLMRRTGER